jgi:sulfinoalanine decarboxylase
MWSGANAPSILGEVIVALSNTSACTFESAPVKQKMQYRHFFELSKWLYQVPKHPCLHF